MVGENSWTEWGKHVLLELEDNKTDHRNIQKALAKIEAEIATLKVKSGVWGFMAGCVPVIIALLVKLLFVK